jgi:hypothetical protein
MIKKSMGQRIGTTIAFLPEIDLDWSSAVVEELIFKAGNIEMHWNDRSGFAKENPKVHIRWMTQYSKR